MPDCRAALVTILDREEGFRKLSDSKDECPDPSRSLHAATGRHRQGREVSAITQ